MATQPTQKGTAMHVKFHRSVRFSPIAAMLTATATHDFWQSMSSWGEPIQTEPPSLGTSVLMLGTVGFYTLVSVAACRHSKFTWCLSAVCLMWTILFVRIVTRLSPWGPTYGVPSMLSSLGLALAVFLLYMGPELERSSRPPEHDLLKN